MAHRLTKTELQRVYAAVVAFERTLRSSVELGKDAGIQRLSLKTADEVRAISSKLDAVISEHANRGRATIDVQ